MCSPRTLVASAVAVGLSLLAAASSARAQESNYLWIEAEEPASATFESASGSRGTSELLSNRQELWQTYSGGQAPDGALRAQYTVQPPEAGRYDVWARIGYEWARAPFTWSLAGQEGRVSPDDVTTNVMRLADWNEIAWIKLGTVDLPAEEQTLTVEVESQGDERTIFSFDCFAVVPADRNWEPDGTLKPGESYDDEQSQQAAEQVFSLPAPEGASRASVELTGLWQVSRWDEGNMGADGEPWEPEDDKPADESLRYMGLPVPSIAQNKRPELQFGHRLVYRTEIDVPAEHQGRSFVLESLGTNWLVSVFVNGELAGSLQSVSVPWEMDVTDFIKPGQTNTLHLVIKGPMYSVDVASMNRGGMESVTRTRNTPDGNLRNLRYIAPVYPSGKGEGHGHVAGVLDPITLVSAGEARVDDAFVRTSVDDMRLDADVTLVNTGDGAAELSVSIEAVDTATGKSVKSFEATSANIAAGESETITLGGDWEEAELWWPRLEPEDPKPQMYVLRTTVKRGDETIDIHEQPFGFREVTVQDTGIYLNGKRFNMWNWVDVHDKGAGPEQALANWQAEDSRFMRFSQDHFASAWEDTRKHRLDWYDENGVPGRLSTSIDGMFITHTLGRGEGDEWTPNEKLWDNFKLHLEQVAKAYRNHPSILVWQAENELVYITGINTANRYIDQISADMNACIEAARAIDPTRPYTVGGAGDLFGRLEVNSPHYPSGSQDWYPENAYTIEKYSSRIEAYPWERDKPWHVGESLFAAELPLGTYVIGDAAYRSRDDANRGKAAYLRMIYGGYRWAGVQAFFPWDNLWQYEDGQKVFHPLYIVPEKQTSRLFSGRENQVTFKAMNDTFRTDPLTLEWSYEAGGKRIGGGSEQIDIEPGFGREFTITITPPETDERMEGELRLKVTQPGSPTYEDVRSIPVLPGEPKAESRPEVIVYAGEGDAEQTRDALRDLGLDPQDIEELSDLPDDASGKLLVVGPSALSPSDAADSSLLAFAVRSGAVLVLEQENPVGGRNLPVKINGTERYGGYAHPQALGTPLFRDLDGQDLIDWAAGHPTYINAYIKPTEGATSLVECGPELPFSALVEVPAGPGVMVLCQLRVGANLGVDPAAGVLLRNLVDRFAGYEPTSGEAAILASGDRGEQLAEAVRTTGAKASTIEDFTAALDASAHAAAIVDGSAEHLQALLEQKDRVDQFQADGGWLMLMNVTPEAIDSLNQLAGTDHLIRPFRVERVMLEQPDVPLAATMGNRDVAMFSDQEIAFNRYFVSRETFTHVLDGPNVAPFTRPPGAPENEAGYEPTYSDNDPYNFVNGMTNADSWRYIRQFGPDARLTFTFPRPEVLSQVNLWNNTNYGSIETLAIIIDGDEANAVTVTLPPTGDVTKVEFDSPRQVSETVTLHVRTFRDTRRPGSGDPLVGLDNVEFIRADSEEAIKAGKRGIALDSAGGLVVIPSDPTNIGNGGIIVNQLDLAAEDTAENQAKKLRILGTLLRNARVGSAGGDQIAVAGVNVRFEPVPLERKANIFLSRTPGQTNWFGGNNAGDLSGLPTGQQVFNDVTFDVIRFTTAPAPDAIALGGAGAPRDLPGSVGNITVGREADVLYFLQAAHVTRPVSDRERERRNFSPPQLGRYVVHYADGSTAEIPIVLGQNVEAWSQPRDGEPATVPDAVVAWSGTSGMPDDRRAVVYSMRWLNPRPDVEIESIDFELADGSNRGTPALIALTTGTIEGESE